MSDREVICAGCVLRQDISDLQQENTALKEKLGKARKNLIYLSGIIEHKINQTLKEIGEE